MTSKEYERAENFRMAYLRLFIAWAGVYSEILAHFGFRDVDMEIKRAEAIVELAEWCFAFGVEMPEL